MDYIGIALIIAVVAGAIHMVHIKAYSMGFDAGKDQILKENMIRSNRPYDDLDESLVLIIKQVLDGEEARHNKSAIADSRRISS